MDPVPQAVGDQVQVRSLEAEDQPGGRRDVFDRLPGGDLAGIAALASRVETSSAGITTTPSSSAGGSNLTATASPFGPATSQRTKPP